MKKYFISLTILFYSLFSFAQISETFENQVMVITQTTESNSDDVLINQSLKEMVLSVPTNEKIRVSAYQYNQQRFLNSLQTAKNANADVRVIFNSNQRDDVDQEFVDVLGKSNVKFKVIGDENNHNKFVLFSKVKFPNESSFRTNVVAQTSCNFKKTSRANDMILIDDDKIYNAYLTYWNKISKSKKDGSKWKPRWYDKSFKGTDSRFKCYFFPRKKKSADPEKNDLILEILENVKGPAEIKILMSKWQNDRGLDIAKKIKFLAEDRKCSFEIIVSKHKSSGGSGGYLDANIETLLKGIDNVTLYTYKKDKPSNHSKVIIIDATNYYNGNAQRIIWTGSHIFNENGLTKNSEAMIKCRVPDVYNCYLNYFNKLKRNGIDGLFE